MRFLGFGIVGLAWLAASCGEPAKKVYTVDDEPPPAKAAPLAAEPWIESGGSLTTTQRRVYDAAGEVRFVAGPRGLPPGAAAGAGDLDGDGAPDWWADDGESAVLVVGNRETERRDGWRVHALNVDVDGDKRDDVVFVQPGQTLAQTPARAEPVSPDVQVLPDLDGDRRFELAWTAGGSVWISQTDDERSISAAGEVLLGARAAAGPELWLQQAGQINRFGGDGAPLGEVALGADALVGLADPDATGQSALLLRGAAGLTITRIDGGRLPGVQGGVGELAAARDFDGDGVRDYLAAACHGEASAGLLAISGRTGQVIGRFVGCPAWSSSAGDYDADGLDDLWTSTPTETTIWLSRRTAPKTALTHRVSP